MTKLIPRDPDLDGDRRKNPENPTPQPEQPRDESDRRRRGRIPDREDCLAALAQLAGAVAMGFLKPAQASAMRASYSEILRYHQKNEGRDDRKGIADADVLELMNKDPRIFAVLEPFLTDEQVDLIMKNAKDGEDGQT